MFIQTDCNFLAERTYENEIFPYKRYKAGDKEADKGVYKGVETEKYPLLLIEEDLVNHEGFGLKKGFYEIRPNKDIDFLILYQSGEVKAKIPVVSVEQIDKTPQKPLSERKKKKIRKKGIVPSEYIYSKAEIFYDKKNVSYLIIWEFKNTKIKGTIKF